jgi:hypothetical protein
VAKNHFSYHIGGTVVCLCSFASLNGAEDSELEEEIVALAAPPARERFTVVSLGCGPSGWAHSYRSSDGEPLYTSCIKYSSRGHANRESQKRMQAAEKIIDRAAKVDSKGKKLGERVIAAFPANDQGIKWVSIIWTDKDLVCSIDAPSIQLALEFERTR